MSVNLRLPNIDGKTDAAQLTQVKSYLYQLVEQLNYALSTIEGGGGSGKVLYTSGAAGAVEESAKNEANATFNSIKSLIIKSADIINSYYEAINKRLSGSYLAVSDFGTYKEETTQDIIANSTGISQLFTNVQEIITDIENLEHRLIEVDAHINSGILYYDEQGVPIYGIEVGQRTEIDGVEVFNKYARFTSDRLSFYDQNDNEVAYISDKKLYITHIEVTGSYTISGFVDTVLADGSVVTKWMEVGADG